jgi:hypothetical protein
VRLSGLPKAETVVVVGYVVGLVFLFIVVATAVDWWVKNP